VPCHKSFKLGGDDQNSSLIRQEPRGAGVSISQVLLERKNGIPFRRAWNGFEQQIDWSANELRSFWLGAEFWVSEIAPDDPPDSEWLIGNLAEKAPNVEVLHPVLSIHEVQCGALTQSHTKESLRIC
jgi:hypothetical protein